nr:O-antigen ligase family protein [Thalassomonas sp. M1454]
MFKPLFNKIFFIFLVIYSIVIIFPVLSTITSRLFILSLFIVIFSLYLTVCSYDRQLLLVTLTFVLWILYLFLLFSLDISQSAFGRIFDIVGFFFHIIIIYSVDLSHNQYRILLRTVTGCLIICVIYQIVALLNDPLLIFHMNYVEQDSNYTNIGNTVYVAFFTITGLSICFLSDENKYLKIILFISLFIYVFLSTKVTIMLLFLFFNFLVCFKVYRVFALFVLVPITLIAFLFVFSSTSDLYNLFPIYVADRLVAINLLLTSGSLSIEVARLDFMLLSLETFLSNPIFGVGGDYIDFKGDFSLIYESGIGHHSELVDFFARYGGVGVVFLSLFLFFYRKQIIRASYYSKVLFFIIFCWLILNNGFSFTFGYLLMFLIIMHKHRKIYD